MWVFKQPKVRIGCTVDMSFLATCVQDRQCDVDATAARPNGTSGSPTSSFKQGSRFGLVCAAAPPPTVAATGGHLVRGAEVKESEEQQLNMEHSLGFFDATSGATQHGPVPPKGDPAGTRPDADCSLAFFRPKKPQPDDSSASHPAATQPGGGTGSSTGSRKAEHTQSAAAGVPRAARFGVPPRQPSPTRGLHRSNTMPYGRGEDPAGAEAGPSSFTSGVNRKSAMLRSQHTVSNLLTFGFPTSQAERDDFKRDVVAVRNRIATFSRRTIDPRSRFVKAWDLITICALLFTAFVTPFEVAFYEPKVSSPANHTNASAGRAVCRPLAFSPSRPLALSPSRPLALSPSHLLTATHRHSSTPHCPFIPRLLSRLTRTSSVRLSHSSSPGQSTSRSIG